MQLVERHIITKGHIHYDECDAVCFKSKNLYNKANYIIRQEFIKTTKEKQNGDRDYAIYLNYFDIRRILIDSDDYVSLPRKVSNQTLMLLDKNWKSFFNAIKDRKKNPSKYKGKPSLPNYKDITHGRCVVVYEEGAISIKGLKRGYVSLSGTDISIPTRQKNIKQCRIVPHGNHFIVEVVYNVDDVPLKEDNGRYCAIDLGLNNLAAITCNKGEVKPYLVNGKPLKSVNHFYNKEKARLQSQLKLDQNRYASKRINKLTLKRNNKITDYLHKSSRYIINHLVSNNINTLIIGYNKEWKQEINIGKRNNQNFVSIPHARFIEMLIYKCKLCGINVIIREESYTSKCSFLDEEEICKHETYMGNRKERGLFISAKGIKINADSNGSYNILKKAVPKAFADGVQGLAVNPTMVTL